MLGQGLCVAGSVSWVDGLSAWSGSGRGGTLCLGVWSLCVVRVFFSVAGLRALVLVFSAWSGFLGRSGSVCVVCGLEAWSGQCFHARHTRVHARAERGRRACAERGALRVAWAKPKPEQGTVPAFLRCNGYCSCDDACAWVACCVDVVVRDWGEGNCDCEA